LQIIARSLRRQQQAPGILLYYPFRNINPRRQQQASGILLYYPFRNIQVPIPPQLRYFEVIERNTLSWNKSYLRYANEFISRTEYSLRRVIMFYLAPLEKMRVGNYDRATTDNRKLRQIIF
jgi:hypothetical protein